MAWHLSWGSCKVLIFTVFCNIWSLLKWHSMAIYLSNMTCRDLTVKYPWPVALQGLPAAVFAFKSQVQVFSSFLWLESALSAALMLRLVLLLSQLSAEVSEWRRVRGSQHLPLHPGVARHAVSDPWVSRQSTHKHILRILCTECTSYTLDITCQNTPRQTCFWLADGYNGQEEIC